MLKSVFAACCVVAAAIAAPPTEINIGGFLLPGSTSDALFKDYAKALTERSHGALHPKLLIYGEAGSEEQVLAGLRRGRVHVGSVSALALSALVPAMEATKVPFLFDSAEQFDAVVDNVLMPEFEAMVADKDLTILRWIDLGGLSLFGRKPLMTPADVKGQRMRASSDLATQAFFKTVGADLVFVAAPELVPSLQTGLLDGGAITTTAYAQTGLAGEAPHLTVTEHAFLGALLLANRRWLAGLSPNDAAMVRDAFAGTNEIRGFFRAEARRLLAEATTRGFTVHRLSPEQRQTWATAVAPSSDEIVAASGAEGRALYDKIIAATRGDKP